MNNMRLKRWKLTLIYDRWPNLSLYRNVLSRQKSGASSSCEEYSVLRRFCGEKISSTLTFVLLRRLGADIQCHLYRNVSSYLCQCGDIHYLGRRDILRPRPSSLLPHSFSCSLLDRPYKANFLSIQSPLDPRHSFEGYIIFAHEQSMLRGRQNDCPSCYGKTCCLQSGSKCMLHISHIALWSFDRYCTLCTSSKLTLARLRYASMMMMIPSCELPQAIQPVKKLKRHPLVEMVRTFCDDWDVFYAAYRLRQKKASSPNRRSNWSQIYVLVQWMWKGIWYRRQFDAAHASKTQKLIIGPTGARYVYNTHARYIVSRTIHVQYIESNPLSQRWACRCLATLCVSTITSRFDRLWIIQWTEETATLSMLPRVWNPRFPLLLIRRLRMQTFTVVVRYYIISENICYVILSSFIWLIFFSRVGICV